MASTSSTSLRGEVEVTALLGPLLLLADQLLIRGRDTIFFGFVIKRPVHDLPRVQQLSLQLIGYASSFFGIGSNVPFRYKSLVVTLSQCGRRGSCSASHCCCCST